MRLFILPVSLVCLTALGACAAGNVSYQSAVLADQVQVTDQTVSTTGPTKQISAADCKRVIEDSAPTASLALDRLKSTAAQSGFNAIHSVKVDSAGAGALLANCWSQVKASGIAYNR